MDHSLDNFIEIEILPFIKRYVNLNRVEGFLFKRVIKKELEKDIKLSYDVYFKELLFLLKNNERFRIIKKKYLPIYSTDDNIVERLVDVVWDTGRKAVWFENVKKFINWKKKLFIFKGICRLFVEICAMSHLVIYITAAFSTVIKISKNKLEKTISTKLPLEKNFAESIFISIGKNGIMTLHNSTLGSATIMLLPAKYKKRNLLTIEGFYVYDGTMEPKDMLEDLIKTFSFLI